MGYAQLDDTFWCNPKVVACPAPLLVLYVRALSYSSHMNTDGVVNSGALRILSGTSKQAAGLVDRGLWESDGAAWRIHDFHDYNVSKAKRDAGKANAQRRYRRLPNDGPAPDLAGSQTDDLADCQTDDDQRNSQGSQSNRATEQQADEQRLPAEGPPGPSFGQESVPRVYALAERVLGRSLRPAEMAMIADKLEGNDPRWVAEALDVTVQNGASNLRYAFSVLEGWGPSGPPTRAGRQQRGPQNAYEDTPEERRRRYAPDEWADIIVSGTKREA